MQLYEFMKESGLSLSKSTAKRFIAGKAVKVNGTEATLDTVLKDGDIVAAGTRIRKYKE